MVTAPTTMARNKISTTVYITYEQDRNLKVLTEKTRVPIAAYIREGIDMVLEKNKHLIPGQLTLPFGEKPGEGEP